MWCRVILSLLIPEYAAVGLALALAIGAVTLVVWFVQRRRTLKRPASILVRELTWFVEGQEISGPCCDVCQVGLMARPLISRADGVAQFELCCPACGKVPVRRGFTLLELVELDQVADQVWASRPTEAKISPSMLRSR